MTLLINLVCPCGAWMTAPFERFDHANENWSVEKFVEILRRDVFIAGFGPTPINLKTECASIPWSVAKPTSSNTHNKQIRDAKRASKTDAESDAARDAI